MESHQSQTIKPDASIIPQVEVSLRRQDVAAPPITKEAGYLIIHFLPGFPCPVRCLLMVLIFFSFLWILFSFLLYFVQEEPGFDLHLMGAADIAVKLRRSMTTLWGAKVMWHVGDPCGIPVLQNAIKMHCSKTETHVKAWWELQHISWLPSLLLKVWLKILEHFIHENCIHTVSLLPLLLQVTPIFPSLKFIVSSPLIIYCYMHTCVHDTWVCLSLLQCTCVYC